MEKIELKIPNLGEAESTEIIEVNIEPGKTVSLNDPLLVLESEKAAMEIPSDFQGQIKEVLIKEGDEVSEGMVFAIMEVAKEETVKAETKDISKIEQTTIQENINEASYVSYSVKGINAGPAVRKYARELEIDLTKILPSGRNKKITKADLIKFIHSGKEVISSYLTFLEDDLSKYGKYSIAEQSKIRALGAKNLHKSWVSIPHVTHFEEVDLTKIMFKRKTLNASVLAHVIEGICKTLKEFPIFNSSLIAENKIMMKKYINIGVAVDTDMGLVVPVIKDTDSLNVEQIDLSVANLAEKARDKKLRNSDLEGSTFTVSSLGKLGGLGFTPIINPPEVAIIAVSNFKKKLVIYDGDVVEKSFLPISLSYDHRVINGVDAGKFMVYLKHILESGND
jgi:pyruvate dehydrogenase E2 component (dihydrolipoamide acetyltransferase)